MSDIILESNGVKARIRSQGYKEPYDWLTIPQKCRKLADEIEAFYKRFWAIDGGEDWQTTLSTDELEGNPQCPGFVEGFFMACEFLEEAEENGNA